MVMIVVAVLRAIVLRAIVLRAIVLRAIVLMVVLFVMTSIMTFVMISIKKPIPMLLRTFNYFIKLPSIQPNTSTIRTVVHFDRMVVRNGKSMITSWTIHSCFLINH